MRSTAIGIAGQASIDKVAGPVGEATIAVKEVAKDSQLKSRNFITLKIKDAVCDRFREESGMRPSVQTLHPDIRIHAFLTRDRYTLYLDTSGESLYKRGLRKQAGLAPINENLAAGILRLSGWKPGEALYDPMCGSGTFCWKPR